MTRRARRHSTSVVAADGPVLRPAHLRDAEDIVLRVTDLVVEYPSHGRRVHAVSGVSFDVRRGETLGLVGESGCGKSSTGHSVVMLPPPTSGTVELGGVDLSALSPEELRRTRVKLQMIFQDPISSLNPRRKIRNIVAEGLDIWGRGHKEQRSKVDEVMIAVGLDPETMGDRHPHEFSGGQCQRICIARAWRSSPRSLSATSLSQRSTCRSRPRF